MNYLDAAVSVHVETGPAEFLARLADLNRDGSHKTLIDGQGYWLGACWGKYSADDKSFNIGNCFIPVGNTVFAGIS
jgi:hypothetical protein